MSMVVGFRMRVLGFRASGHRSFGFCRVCRGFRVLGGLRVLGLGCRQSLPGLQFSGLGAHRKLREHNGLSEIRVQGLTGLSRAQ